MDNPKNKIRQIFDIDEDSKLDQNEKENLYKDIVHQGRRKRIFRFGLQVSAIAAVLIGGILLFYIGPDEAEPVDIRSVAMQNQSLFHETADVQVASRDIVDDIVGLSSISEIDVSEETRLFIPYEKKGHHYSTVYVPYGRRQEILLPDSSSVWLNAGSYLTFNNSMADGDREVYLNGEGFFDVRFNGKPFVVKTFQANIDVLGTSFNAFSYEDEDEFSVELLTGKIELNSPQSKFDKISMRPGERIAIDTKRNKIQKSRDGTGEDVLWTKKQLALKNIKMKDLLRRIERIYNVDIKAADEVYNMGIAYSGRLNVGVDIVTSLSSIYELRNYDIIIKEKEVFIQKK